MNHQFGYSDPVRNLRECGKYILDHAEELIGDYQNEPIASVRVTIDPDGAEKPPCVVVTRKTFVLHDD